jgi:hypothetical protein
MLDRRNSDYKADLSQLLARTRELVRQAAQQLRDPLPDTFLGRKTQEPFPREETD